MLQWLNVFTSASRRRKRLAGCRTLNGISTHSLRDTCGWILNGYGYADFLNVACASCRGCRRTNSTSASKECSQTCRYTMWTCRLHFPMNNTQICSLSTGFVMTTGLLTLRNIGDDFHNDESRIDVCSVMFKGSCEKNGLFPSMSSTAERPLSLNVDKNEDIIQMSQRSPRVSTRRISARLHVPVRKTLQIEGL
jgi:hypothetical protein